MGVIHRDLKPENILMYSKNDNNYDIRIADFGLALLESDIEIEKRNPIEY
jgi:serine/threonine protein kinase